MADDKEMPQAEVEAFRLRALAEKKYSAGDLKSALEYAEQAHHLAASADGVSEMLTAFEILRTATIPVVTPVSEDDEPTTATSTLPDFYKILQIERFSHINTIKKQYKKLALTLHPDKNPFLASEEAFKLVGEAFRVLSDKIRRKEYDVKLRIAMQSAVMTEGQITTTFSTACSTCQLLHQFDRKYLGHNLMCPSCKKSFKAIEVSEDGKNIGVSVNDVKVGDSSSGKMVSARTKAGKVSNLGKALKRSRGKMTRNVDEIAVEANEAVNAKRDVKEKDGEIKGDVDSDDCLIEGFRSRTRCKAFKRSRGKMTRNVEEIGVEANEAIRAKRDVEEKDGEMEGDVDSDDCLIEGFRSRTKGALKGSRRKMTRNVDEIGVESNEAIRAKRGVKEKVCEIEGDVDSDDCLIEGFRSRAKGALKGSRRIMTRNVDKIGVEYNEVIRAKKGGKEKVCEIEGDVDSDDCLIKGFRSRTKGKLLRDVGEGEEETMTLAQMQMSVKRKKMSKEDVMGEEKGEEKEEHKKVMELNPTGKDGEKRKEDMYLNLIEEEDETEMEMPIARVREKWVRRDKKVNYANVVEKEKGEENVENNKGIEFNSTEKDSEKRKETHLSLIVEEDEVEMETPIARVGEKKVRCEALKRDLLEDGRRRTSISSKRDGEGSRQDDLEIIAVESFDIYNFDKDRVERSFKKGQVWAVYDDDGMPRDYALIDEVVSVHPFVVRLNWLEFQSNTDKALVHWGKMGFHISCGKFKVSRQASVKSLKKFSHVVDCERAARELYRIYPSKGSIWALYKENAVGAGSRTDKQCYDIVISLSSYTDRHGVSIAYLEKVDELRPIFKRREVGSHAVRLVGKDELRLFSHRIPARKLSNEEASNICKSCWELDQASLPRESLAIGWRS